ncbi:MAG: helix-turn-helix domain-containing protein [Myxococcota bacterium]
MAFPATSFVALLDGMQSLGFDTETPRRQWGITPGAPEPELLLPREAWIDVVVPLLGERPTLAFEIGSAVPFGSFGIVDYLVGSSETVLSGLLSLETHFSGVASAIGMAVDANGTSVEIRFFNREGGIDWSLEFALGVVVGRFSDAQSKAFRPQRIWLRREPSSAFDSLVDCEIVFSSDRIGLDLDLPTAKTPMRLSDPRLHQTMKRVAQRLSLGASVSELDTAVRARLRELLPRGSVDATTIARLLGMSDRTFSRRLSEGGTSFRAVLDAFRAEESERHLIDGNLTLAQIADRLGYNDQSAWTRAFKRWRGDTPSGWLAKRKTR